MEIIKKILIYVLEAFFAVYFNFFKKTEIDKELENVTALYKGNGFEETFSKIRTWDTPYEKIEAEVPLSGTIADLGCGEGIFSNYLAIKSKKRIVKGIDLNGNRVKHADKGIKNASFKKGDITNEKLGKIRAATLIHVLHHLPSKNMQAKVLENIYNNLNKHGKLVIVEIAERPTHKYFFTWLVDTIAVPILFEKKLIDSDVNYRSTKQWKSLLKKIGFDVRSKLIDSGKPFSHVLLICEKR